MDNLVLFEETQRFKQWWIWVPLIVLGFFSIYSIVGPVIFQELHASLSTVSYVFFMLAGITLFLLVLFYFLKLETVITEEAISARLFPLQIKFRKFDWPHISGAYVRKYNPLREYGGWGSK